MSELNVIFFGGAAAGKELLHEVHKAEEPQIFQIDEEKIEQHFFFLLSFFVIII